MRHDESSDGPRTSAVRSLAEGEYDVLVIGGGITGAGVARDAAMRGLRVGLVEKNDFGSGTSSRSSRLVHGGVRYLEHGQLRLVFESSRERRTLLRIAPHLVHPLRFTWPVYKGARIPAWKLSLGLATYDALSLFRNPRHHRRLTSQAIVEREPALNADALEGGAEYWDAATNDSRLTLATVLAAHDAGATVLNHAEVVAIKVSQGRGSEVIVATVEGETITARARWIVNATGPWSDFIETLAGNSLSLQVRASKGVHIAVRSARAGNTGALTLLAPQDGRVMFVLPAGAQTIIGTTDTFDAASPDSVRATEADVAYLIAAANHYLPGARLARADVIAAWAGLRPLAAGTAASADPGAASREHSIEQTAPGMIRVTGGKLTTYRAMSEEIVNRLVRLLGHDSVRCQTANVRLPGADRATAVQESIIVDSALGACIGDSVYTLAEIRYATELELAYSLGDLLIRRTHLAFETRDNGRSAARYIAPHVASWLGWSDEEVERQLTEYDAEVDRTFTVMP